MNSFILMVIPDGNDYTVEKLNEQAVPHLKQLGYTAIFKNAKEIEGIPISTSFIKVEMPTDEIENNWHRIRAILQEHYGLTYIAHRL